MEPVIVYYSSTSGNTQRFIQTLNIKSIRIPISMKEEYPVMQENYVLMCPCYADDDGSKAVPKQVIRFLNDPQNRQYIKGVIASGNRNFGKYFAYSGDVIAKKCNVPCLYKYELSGTIVDTQNVKIGMRKLWEEIYEKEDFAA